MGDAQHIYRGANVQPVVPSDELAVRQLPLRAIVALDILARCEGRLHVAARMQGVSPSALSTQITRLETALGVDVVKRSAADLRRFDLTEKGDQLVEALRGALPALVELTTSLHQTIEAPEPVKRRRDRRIRRSSSVERQQ